MALQHWYLHADLDAFFASVEQLDHPEYRGKPLIVGGLPSDPRSVVSTASYEARKYGVHSAMPTREAYRLCPNGIYIHGNYHRYEEVSWQIMQIFKRWSPDVQQMSIDEAFIDLTGTERLFGPPEETAMKIKKEVFEETGLTISIGLACTKYFAKLSSEINKPDGFYFMKPGTETDYMLSIPIEKIWGIGKKTSTRIKDSGLRTTRQIYETDLSTLTFLYGENTANFLYNILRGKADDMFGTEAKSHSISNERTFPFDITDAYACETALMELAHTVMFRLLRENLHSRTVVIKIRYDDFSTVSARQTYETDIITLDSFFEKVRDIFNRKYERTRGIRLLGVGFDNVHKEESTYQQNLFDDGQKKKQAVEKAILKLETKYPELHVQKARLIKPKVKGIISFLLVSFLSVFSAQKAFASESSILNEPEILPVPGEAPAVLFDISKNDSKIEILSSGFWKAEATESAAFSFNSEKKSGANISVPVFKQDVNLDFNLIYNQQWFFNTSFAEQFKKNTIAFGFINGKTIQKAILSNRNILYPSDYASSDFNYNPSGGSINSPGFAMNMSGENWQADFLIRYDLTQKKEAVFYGSNQVTDFHLSPGNYISGRFFSLPEGYIHKIASIYIENKNGDILSSDGRKFKRLSHSQFALNYQENFILISREAAASSETNSKPYILVTFDSDKTLSDLITAMGSFSDSDSFFGNIQKVFSKNGKTNLKDYWPKSESQIENKKALIMQTGKKFSPFENTSFYDAGLISECDFIVQSKTTNLEKQNYKTSSTDTNLLYSGNDYFNDSHLYFQISSDAGDNDFSLRFPFAAETPEIYLSNDSDCDTEILLRNYSPVSFFQIPTTASSGSVKVTVNGILDAGAVFDSDTGFVTLSTPFQESDRIIISWNEEGTGKQSGAFTAAAGIKTTFTPDFSGNFDITTSWPVSSFEKQSDTEENLQGFISLNGQLLFQKDFLNIKNSSSIAFSNYNTSGKLLVYRNSGLIPETHYHSGTAASNISEKLYIEGYDFSNIISCLQQENFSGIKDKEISGFAFPLEFDFTEAGTNAGYTGCEVNITSSESSHSFNIALKPSFENPSEALNNVDLFLQLGINGIIEDAKPEENSVPTWNITNLLDFENPKWQEISIDFSEKDRAHFSEYKDLRLIAVKHENSLPSSVYGKILIGPYEFIKHTLPSESSKGVYVKNISYEEGKSNIIATTWESASHQEEPYIKLSDYFNASDYSLYESINLDLRIINLEKDSLISDESDTFIFSLFRNSEKIVEFSLSPEILEKLQENPDKWNTISLNLSDKCIYINNTKISENHFLISNFSSLIPNRFELTFCGFESGKIETKDIYYEGNCLSFALQNRFEAKLQKDAHSLYFASKINERLYPSENFFIETEASGKTSILGLNISGDLKLQNTDNPFETGGHSISLAVPLFGVINFSEDFRFSPYVKTSEKNRKASLNLSKIKIPVSATLNTHQKESSSGYSEKTEAGLSLNSKIISGKLDYSNKQQAKINIKNNYFTTYTNFEKEFFNFGNEEANLRTQNYSSELSALIPFASLSPKFTFSLSDTYSFNREFLFSDKEFFSFSLPFSINKNTVSFSWQKESENPQKIAKLQNFATDTARLFDLQKDRLFFYETFLFEDLFRTSINGNYSSDYGITWNRPISNSLKDFFIPVSLSINTGRVIENNDLFQDFYQTKFSTSMQAINLFGKESSRKVFSWYSTDEFISSFEFTTKTPSENPEETLFSVSLYSQMFFYIASGNSLKAAGDLYIQTNNDWNSRQSIVYTSIGKKSPLETIILMIGKNKITKTKTKISRKEIFNSEFGKSNNENFESFSLSHFCEVNFLTYYSVYSEAEASFSHKQNKGDTLGISLTLGGKITY